MSCKQILQRHPSPFLVGTILSVSLLGTACSSSTPKAKAPPPGVPVRLEKLQSNTVKESSEFVGNLEAVNIVEVLPEIEGRVERILVQPGQRVRAGQPLMLLKADKTVPQHRADLAKIDIAKGDRQNAMKQLDIAKARRDTAKAELKVNSSYVPRIQTLVKEGAVPQLRLDEILQKQVASRNNLIAAEQEVAAAKVAIRKADNNIRQVKAQADASLVSVRSKSIVAPIAGILGELPVKLGDYVSTGQSVVAKVAQTEALLLNIEVPSNRSTQLKKGLTVELLDPKNKEKLSTGSLTFVSPTINTKGQTILTKARFPNVEGKLRDGQNVQARIIWDTQPGLLIPTTAISRVGGKEFVFLVNNKANENGQQVVSLKPVELGNIQGSSFQVISGLKAGDRIAVSNILKLRDGVPIQPES